MPAWWGFTTADDKRRLKAFVRRGVQLNLYDQQEPTIAQLVGQRENSLFQAILDDDSHVIHHLPPSVSNTYNLRPRRHQRQLTIKPDNKNFLNRKLYEDIYYSHFIDYISFTVVCWPNRRDFGFYHYTRLLLYVLACVSTSSNKDMYVLYI